MCLPPFFNDALDIKRTVLNNKLVWTQGGAFSFKNGDVIYDTIDGYLCANEAIKKVKLCIQITAAKGSMPASNDGERDRGNVAFTVYVPNREKSGFIVHSYESITHDDFVRLLIGDNRIIKSIGLPIDTV